ncbi:MAG: exodeoxyribonuclease III [Myxococcales bacterium]|nr:exodeoxyribonuclease III [Myxococcales bacterium]
MRIVTWNVNSVRSREERLLRWLDAFSPEVLCLQELKCEDPEFPWKSVEARGYTAAVFGQKTYNGVAILSRLELADVTRGLADGDPDEQARLIAATVAGIRVVCVYVPNGSEVGSAKYAYKRAWLKRLRTWLDRHADPHAPLVLCGDLNIAPDARDVGRPAAWRDTVLYSDEMTHDLAEVSAWGLNDAFRRHRPEPGIFSWWDYRAGGFPKNDGLRIDHVLATAAVRTVDAFADRNERMGDKPSDHVPVGIVLATAAN